MKSVLPFARLPRSRVSSLHRAFTLVELLIVIAIIGVLIGLIIPGVGRVQKMSRFMACRANIRSIFAATFEYANEHNGQLPMPVKDSELADPIAQSIGAWPMTAIGTADFKNGKFWKYIATSEELRHGVVWCPADGSEAEAGVAANTAGTRNFSYSFNSLVRDKFLKRNQVVLPSERIYIFEEIGPNDTYGVLRANTNTDNTDRPTGRHGTAHNLQYGSDDYNNNGLGNFGFFDGHIESIAPIDMGNHPEWFDPTK